MRRGLEVSLAEAHAIQMALIEAKARGFDCVEVESDAKEVVDRFMFKGERSVYLGFILLLKVVIV